MRGIHGWPKASNAENISISWHYHDIYSIDPHPNMHPFKSHSIIKKAVSPMLVQRWYTTIGVMLRQRWPNVSVPMLSQRWANWQINVGPTSVCRRWPNVRVDVGPTLGQRRNASWDGISKICKYHWIKLSISYNNKCFSKTRFWSSDDWITSIMYPSVLHLILREKWLLQKFAL